MRVKKTRKKKPKTKQASKKVKLKVNKRIVLRCVQGTRLVVPRLWNNLRMEDLAGKLIKPTVRLHAPRLDRSIMVAVRGLDKRNVINH